MENNQYPDTGEGCEAWFSEGNVFGHLTAYKNDDGPVTLAGMQFIFLVSDERRETNLQAPSHWTMECPVVHSSHSYLMARCALNGMRVFNPSQIEGFARTISEFASGSFFIALRPQSSSTHRETAAMNPSFLVVQVELDIYDDTVINHQSLATNDQVLFLDTMEPQSPSSLSLTSERLPSARVSSEHTLSIHGDVNEDLELDAVPPLSPSPSNVLMSVEGDIWITDDGGDVLHSASSLMARLSSSPRVSLSPVMGNQHGSPRVSHPLMIIDNSDMGMLQDEFSEVDEIPQSPPLSNSTNLFDGYMWLVNVDEMVYNQNNGIFPAINNFGTTPVPRSALDALRSSAYFINVAVDAEHKESCSICLEFLTVGDEVINLPCNHHFHGICILQWLQTNNSCPLCREALPIPQNPLLEYFGGIRRHVSQIMQEVSSIFSTWW